MHDQSIGRQPPSHMSRSISSLLASLATISLLAACGGQGSGAVPVTQANAPATTLSLSTPRLALAASGQARSFTVTNTGSQTAMDLGTSASGLPAGTTLASTCGNSLAAGASCSITVTPGATPTAPAGDTAPVVALVDVAGSNTNALTAQVSVLTHGSVHQGGFVFAIDDTPADTLSVSGKVAALADVVSTVSWSTAYTDVPGIDWSDTPGPDSCAGASDGRCNTAQIMANPPPNNAASLCVGSSDGGHSDWYLPAVCELTDASFCGGQPDTIGSRLAVNGIGTLAGGQYWSSTQRDPGQAILAAVVSYDGAGGSSISTLDKTFTQIRVRCARAMTP